eukprot:5316836-Amphidinium_carterae.1
MPSFTVSGVWSSHKHGLNGRVTSNSDSTPWSRWHTGIAREENGHSHWLFLHASEVTGNFCVMSVAEQRVTGTVLQEYL